MILFGILFALNVIAGLVAMAFFAIGLGDGTVTTSNILLWAVMLSVLFSLPGGAWLVRVRGRPRLGTWLLVPVALLTFVAGAWLLLMIVNPPDWR